MHLYVLAASAALAGVSMSAASMSAYAATPVISGKYVTNYKEICQTNGQSGNADETYSEALVADFDAATATVKISGTEVTGPLIVASCCSTKYTVKSGSRSSSYSNTATTITVNGATSNAIYAPLKNGIAQSVTFVGISTGGCAVSATAFQQ